MRNCLLACVLCAGCAGTVNANQVLVDARAVYAAALADKNATCDEVLSSDQCKVATVAVDEAKVLLDAVQNAVNAAH